MKYSRVLIIAVVIMLITLAGCGEQVNEPADPTVADQISTQKPDETSGDLVEVTEPNQLEHLWSKYIYDGIYTVYNQQFKDPSEIENTYYLVSHALTRLVKDGDVEKLATYTSSTEINIPTAEQVEGKIKQYFNIDVKFDVDKMLREDFKVTPDMQTMEVYSEQYPYNAVNPWGIKLKSVIYDKRQGEYHVALDAIVNFETGRVGHTTYIVLKERPDKSLYFVSVKTEYPETSLVEVIGDYTTLKAEDFGSEMNPNYSPVSVLGVDVGGKMLVQASRLFDSNDFGSNTITTFSIFDPQTNQVEKRSEVPQTPGGRLHGVRILHDKLIFKMSDGFYVTDLNLSRQGESFVPLPEVVKKALADKDHTGAYDVSTDLSKITFVDKNGLYLYDRSTGETVKLSSHIPVDSDLFDTSYIIAPYFSANDEAVISQLSGYEGSYGVMALNLAYPDQPYIGRHIFTVDSIGSTNVMYPVPDIQISGVTIPAEGTAPEVPPAFDIEIFDLELQSNPSNNVTREIKEVTFKDGTYRELLTSIGNIPMYNGKYLAYVAADGDNHYSGENEIYYLVRIDLETMEAETVLAIKAGMPSIRGITGDGRILFSYYFEREMGLGITGR